MMTEIGQISRLHKMTRMPEEDTEFPDTLARDVPPRIYDCPASLYCQVFIAFIASKPLDACLGRQDCRSRLRDSRALRSEGPAGPGGPAGGKKGGTARGGGEGLQGAMGARGPERGAPGRDGPGARGPVESCRVRRRPFSAAPSRQRAVASLLRLPPGQGCICRFLPFGLHHQCPSCNMASSSTGKALRGSGHVPGPCLAYSQGKARRGCGAAAAGPGRRPRPRAQAAC